MSEEIKNQDHKEENDRSAEFLENIIELINSLPEIPPAIMDLRMAISDPSTDYTDLVAILEKDEVLCADLLKFANSAYYGIEHKVESITEAVRYFGMTNLVELTAASFSERVIRHTFSDLSDLGSYFKHALDISRSCGMLTSAMGAKQREQELYIMAGLLHDIGRPVEALTTNRTSAALGGTSWDRINDIIIDEKDVAGIDHAEIGARICARWGFPDKLASGILRHHTPAVDNAPFSYEGAIIHLSHYIAMPNLPHGRLKQALPERAFEKLNIDAALLYDTRVAFISKFKN